MQLVMVLMTVACLQVQAKGCRRSFPFQGRTSFQNHFLRAGKTNGYVVFYNTDMLRRTKPVTISAKNMQLETFLRKVMTGQPIDFQRSTALLSPSKEKPVETTTPVNEALPAGSPAFQRKSDRQQGQSACRRYHHHFRHR